MKTASTTTLSSVWAPKMTRDSTSVDCTLVPNQCADEGCCCLTKRTPLASRYWSKLYGASTGAATAITTNTSVITTPDHRIQRGTPRASRTGSRPRAQRDPAMRLLIPPVTISGAPEGRSRR